MDNQRQPFTRAQKIACVVISVAAAVLIGVSGFALAFPDALSDASNAADGTSVSTQEGAPDASSTAGTGANETAETRATGQGESAQSGNTAAASSGKASAASNANGTSGATGSSGSADSSANQNATEKPATVTVSVSVSSSAVGGPVSGGTTATFNQGASAYDALMACGLSVNASNSAYGVYVSAIGGLAEKEHGANSGWMYSVNGTAPAVSCSSYILRDGDSVQWYYTV